MNQRRPYIVITHFWQIYGDDRRIIEKVEFRDNLRDEDIRSATVIVDLLENRVVKCREDVDHEELVEAIHVRFGEDIRKALADFRIREHQRAEARRLTGRTRT